MTTITPPGSPNVPEYVEDSNSPVSISGGTTTSINLSATYEVVLVVFTAGGTNGNSVDVQVNGDTAGNYNDFAIDGSENFSESSFTVAQDNSMVGGTLQLSGRWDGWFTLSNSPMTTESFITQLGENDVVASPLDSIRFFNAASNSITFEARVYGIPA